MSLSRSKSSPADSSSSSFELKHRRQHQGSTNDIRSSYSKLMSHSHSHTSNSNVLLGAKNEQLLNSNNNRNMNGLDGRHNDEEDLTTPLYPTSEFASEGNNNNCCREGELNNELDHGFGRLSQLDNTAQTTAAGGDSGALNNNIIGITTEMKRKRQWAVMLYGLTTILLYADQNLLSPNLTAIANEFGFDAMERDYYLGGQIAIGFWLVGAPASYIVGILGDRYHRTSLFVVTVCIGEGSCLATYFTRTYQGLYITRVLTGFSVGGAIPLIYSLLGDYYPPDERSAVNAVVGMGVGLGIAIGQGIAGYLGPTFGWRVPFLVVSIPAIICAIWVYLTVEDPKRGQMDNYNYQQRQQHSTRNADMEEDSHNANVDGRRSNEEDNNYDNEETSSIIMTAQQDVKSSVTETDERPIDINACTQQSSRINRSGDNREDNNANENNNTRFNEQVEEEGHNAIRMKGKCRSYLSSVYDHLRPTLNLLRIPTVLFVLVQAAPGCIPWGIINTYLNDYLSENKGFTVEGATTLVLTFGYGVFLGMLLAGAAGTYLYRCDSRYPQVLAGTMAIVGVIPMYYVINGITSDTNPVIRSMIAILAGLGSGVTGPIVKATLTNVTLPTSRGAAFALLNTFDDVGRGLGPMGVAMLIMAFDGNRQRAFNVGVMGWIVCGITNLAICFVVKHDEQIMRRILQQQQQMSTMTSTSTPTTQTSSGR